MDTTNNKYAICLMLLGKGPTVDFYSDYPELLISKYNHMTISDLKQRGFIAYALAIFKDGYWIITDGNWATQSDRQKLEKYIDKYLNKLWE